MCYRQGSVCTSVPHFLHSFGSTGSGHMAQRWCTVHHPCRPHSLSHHARQKKAVHVCRRELAAHTLSLLHTAPGHTSRQQFAAHCVESCILAQNCSTKMQKTKKPRSRGVGLLCCRVILCCKEQETSPVHQKLFGHLISIGILPAQHAGHA